MDFKKYLNQFYTSEKNTHSIFPCDKFKKGSKLKIPKGKLNEFYEKCHYLQAGEYTSPVMVAPPGPGAKMQKKNGGTVRPPP